MWMLAAISPLLGQAHPQRDIFLYLGVIAALVCVLVAVAVFVRRRVLSEDPGPGSFTLSDIRRLHASGELSDAEFDAARRKMIAQQRAALLADESGKNSAPRPDKDGDDGAASGV